VGVNVYNHDRILASGGERGLDGSCDRSGLGLLP
jgi:hypothetical protein